MLLILEWLNDLIGWITQRLFKLSKLSQSETSGTFCEFECRKNVLFKSKSQFLKVKSAFKPGRIAAHENLDIINMTIWKQKYPKTEPDSKFIKKFYKIRRRLRRSDAVVSPSCFELMWCMNKLKKTMIEKLFLENIYSYSEKLILKGK